MQRQTYTLAAVQRAPSGQGRKGIHGRGGPILQRKPSGPAPQVAPKIVQEVLSSPGRPLPSKVRTEMEARFGHTFADVRIHDGELAATSAQAVNAQAYTVGRQVVFAQGHFHPSTEAAKRLLLHELSHVADYPPALPAPSGDLRISRPSEAAERKAVAASEGRELPAPLPSNRPRLHRQASGLVPLTGVRVNHDRVTVPPVGGLTFRARKRPANASGVTFTLVGDNATINSATTIDSRTGVITVAAAQTGGSAHVAASQNAHGPGGGTLVSTSPATAPFNFTAIPTGITSTSASPTTATGVYGGDFIHTFTSPGGGQSALERTHVNERFAAARGTTLRLRGALINLNLTVNNPNSATAGWNLDASGTMAGPDHVTWSNTADARPFVSNASNPNPRRQLPQALTATQNFRNLTFPAQTYAATAVATTTHRRAIEERTHRLKAVTSANASGINQEIVEDYVGPTVFRRCRANPPSVRRSLPTPPGGSPPAVDTTTVSVDAEGQAATPAFTIRPPDLGCTITAAGVLTPGQTAGTITVRAGDRANYDETSVIIKPRPATFIRLDNASTPDQIIGDYNLAERGMDSNALRRLNPELHSQSTFAAGTVIWLKAREVPAAATGFESIAERYFGSRYRWPALWSYNPHITDPSSIVPATRIHLQSAADRSRFGEVALVQ